jgi:hypothetical protein
VTWTRVWWGVGLFVVSFAGSLAVVAWVMVKLPATYFQDNHHPRLFAWAERHPLLNVGVLIAKNLLGLSLVILGIILSLPGVPGQGLLTIFIGLLLLNYPGKRRLERWLVSRPSIRQGIDQLRARFGEPPLDLDDPPPPTSPPNRPSHAAAPRR